MSVLNVNATRMEMQNLKHRLFIAQRGHKLLKEKQDSLIGQFSLLVEEARQKRKLMEVDLTNIKEQFYLADIQADSLVIQKLLEKSESDVELQVTQSNTRGIKSPVYKLESNYEQVDTQPYSYVISPVFLDRIQELHHGFMESAVALAMIEKKCQIIASELKMTRRRVNSLEYKTIPNLEETITMIRMKIDDNERSQLARMIRIK